MLGKVNTGGKLSVYAIEGSWLKVSYQGQYGYVSKSYTKYLDGNGNPIGAAMKEVTANETLNVYVKATSNSKKIGTVAQDATVSVYNESGGYYLTIIYGLPGYIVKESTTTVENENPAPTPDPVSRR